MGREGVPGAVVLLVEDDAALSVMYALGLKLGGYTVMTAADGIEALDVIDEACPDIVVLDLQLPRLDGYGVLTSLGKRPLGIPMPVLVLSNQPDSCAAAVTALGAEAFLQKSRTSPRQLCARVADVLLAGRLQTA